MTNERGNNPPAVNILFPGEVKGRKEGGGRSRRILFPSRSGEFGNSEYEEDSIVGLEKGCTM